MIIDKEYYHYSLAELTEAFGQEKAKAIARMYADMVRKHGKDITVLVNCRLLQPYIKQIMK